MEQMTMTTAQRSSLDRSLETTVRQFNDAFNRRDAREVASFWTDDGTLLNPIGNYGEGRAGVERVFGEDAQTILRDSTATFRILRVRPVGDGAFVDLDIEMQNAPMPDGGRGTTHMHAVMLARRQGDGWKWVDARPYAILPRPQLH